MGQDNREGGAGAGPAGRDDQPDATGTCARAWPYDASDAGKARVSAAEGLEPVPAGVLLHGGERPASVLTAILDRRAVRLSRTGPG